MNRIRKNFTYANCISLAVIVAASGGTAFATGLLTGKNFKDGTVTGADIKNGSLLKQDVSLTGWASLRGPAGDRGVTGGAGSTGPQGPVGDTGPRGASAHSLVRFASSDSDYIVNRADVASPPNPGASDWDATTYSGMGGHPGFSIGGMPTQITNNEPTLLELTGTNETTTGTIRPTGNGRLSASATITVLHQNNREVNYEGGDQLHGRIKCQLRYANNGQPITAGSTKLGTHEWVSSPERHKLMTVTIAGSVNVSSGPTTNYNVGVTCADVDFTGFTQWVYTAGNLTAHSTWVES